MINLLQLGLAPFFMMTMVFTGPRYLIQTPPAMVSQGTAYTLKKSKHRLQFQLSSSLELLTDTLTYSYGLHDNTEIGFKYMSLGLYSYYNEFLGLYGKYNFINKKLKDEAEYFISISGEAGTLSYNFLKNLRGEGEDHNSFSLQASLLVSYKKGRFEPYASLSTRTLQCMTDVKDIQYYKDCFIEPKKNTKTDSTIKETDSIIKEKESDSDMNVPKKGTWLNAIYANAGLKAWILPERLATDLGFTYRISPAMYSSNGKYSDNFDINLSLSYSF